MSEGFHVNMSQLVHRKEVSASSYTELSLVLIKAVLSGCSSLRTMVFVWLSECSWDLDAESSASIWSWSFVRSFAA